LAYNCKRHVIKKRVEEKVPINSTVVLALVESFCPATLPGIMKRNKWQAANKQDGWKLQRYPQSYYRNFFGENLFLKFRCAIIPQLTLLPSKSIFRGNLLKVIFMAREYFVFFTQETESDWEGNGVVDV
jgi:hypothetical protein